MKVIKGTIILFSILLITSKVCAKASINFNPKKSISMNLDSEQMLATDSLVTTNSVISKDGTKIGYQQYGKGPGLVLVQGAMGTTFNYDQLAKALSNDFTVYVPERRGRKLSPKEYTPQHSIDREVEDVSSILEKTGAHYIFGLSSGAIITLESTKLLSTIQKTILYEPPFYVEPVPVKKIENVFQQIEEGKTVDAMISAFKIVKVGPSFFNFAPRFILRLGVKKFLKDEDEKGVGKYEYTKKLLPSMRFDFKVVLDKASQIASYKTVNKPILLLGGSKSPKYLKEALSSLEKTLPNVRRTEFEGLDHNAPWNTDKLGSPEIVAKAIIAFLK
jgi:pimeloyl-ACP methyl ester carboxylesterase